MAAITVICPTHNRGPAILGTIASVQAQTERDWELLVVSDASDDDTDEVVQRAGDEDSRVRLLRTDRRFGGPSGGVNLGLREAATEYVACIDHDDLWRPDHLATVLPPLEAGAGFVSTRARYLDDRGRIHKRFPLLCMYWHPLPQLLMVLFHNSAVAHRTDLALEVGGWRSGGHGLEDWDLWVRMTDAGARAVTIDADTVDLLYHGDSLVHQLEPEHMHEIARFDDGLEARKAQRTLLRAFAQPEWAAAIDADFHALYKTLDEQGELVAPRGWDGTLHEALREPGATAHHVFASQLSLRRIGGAWVLGWPIATVDADHAARASRAYREVMARQQELLGDLVPADALVA